MKIRLLRPFRVYKRNAVLDMDDGAANAWIRSGIAVPEPQQTLLETATVEVRSERADATPKPRKRTR